MKTSKTNNNSKNITTNSSSNNNNIIKNKIIMIQKCVNYKMGYNVWNKWLINTNNNYKKLRNYKKKNTLINKIEISYNSSKL